MYSKIVSNKPVWNSVSESKSFPALTWNLETEIAIVGGGITGLTVAYLLAKSGKNVVVLEAGQVGKGTTGMSTGNLYVPIDAHLFSIAEKHGVNVLKDVVESRKSAIDFIEQVIIELGIECDFQRLPWHLFDTSPHYSHRTEVIKEFETATKAGLLASSEILDSFPLPATSLTTIPDQAQFNPLAFTKGLASRINSESCQIFEHTSVLKVTDGDLCIVETYHGLVKAEKVVMATHSPKGIYAVHATMEAKREFALAVRVKQPLPPPGIYWHFFKGNRYSFRPVRTAEGEFLLVLGGSYKVGNTASITANYLMLEEYIREHFDIESIGYTWAAQNYRPADLLPYIGNSLTEENILIATGFSADGLVYGTLAAMIIHDLILKKENKFADSYDPKRFTPWVSAKTVLKENFEVTRHLIKDYLFYDKTSELISLARGEGKTLTLNNEKIAAYRDLEGQLHLVSSVCTHLGCIVHWNGAEKSWDCPCHGSRFTVTGQVIEGPAFYDLAKPHENSNH